MPNPEQADTGRRLVQMLLLRDVADRHPAFVPRRDETAGGGAQLSEAILQGIDPLGIREPVGNAVCLFRQVMKPG